MKFHPLCEMFPSLPAKEMHELTEDIKANGQREPIILDQDDLVIDGRHRAKACEAAGIVPKTRKVKFDDDAERAAYIHSANINRRHLTLSGRARMAAKLVSIWQKKGGNRSKEKNLNSSGETIKSVSAKTGVPKSYIFKAGAILQSEHADLKEKLDSDPNSLHKTYAELKTRQKAEDQKLPKPVAPSVLDQARDETAALSAILARVQEIKGELSEILREKSSAFISEQAASAAIENLARSLKAGLPHALCPYCWGDKCKACKQLGWMPKILYDAAPRELKREPK